MSYEIKLKAGDREWMSEPCKTYTEALAFKAYFEAGRATEKAYSLRLMPKKSAEIIGDKADADASVFWYFDRDYRFSVKIDGGKVSTDIDNKDFLERYAPVVNCEGKYALVDIIELKVLLPPVYKYISVNYQGYAEVITQLPDTDDFRELVCDGLYYVHSQEFVPIPRGKCLCNSFDYEDFQVVDDGLVYRCVLKDGVAECVSRGYNEIMKSMNEYSPVQDAQSLLWGFMDEDGKEIITCKYHDFDFFNDGYAVLKDENGKPFIIDENENIVIQSIYDEIEHYKHSFFFVRLGGKRAVFSKDKQLTKWAEYDDNFEWKLKLALADYYKAFHPKRYEMPIAEYIKLFPEMRSEPDLRLAGLWMHPVDVAGDYPATSGYIGWHYPVDGSIFEMSVEMPVDFKSASIGVPFDQMRLVDANIQQRRKQLYDRLMALDSDGIQFILKTVDRRDIFMFIFHQDEALQIKFLNECSQRVVDVFIQDVEEKLLDVLSDETLISGIEEVLEEYK